MLLVLISALLSLAALAGMAFTVLQGSLMTVDGLFFTLILAAIFTILSLNTLYELRHLRAKRASTKGGGQGTAPQTRAAASGTGSGPALEAEPSEVQSDAVSRRSTVLTVPSLPRRTQRKEPVRKSARQSTVDGITAGTVLIRTDLALPEAMDAGAQPFVSEAPAVEGVWGGNWRVAQGSTAWLERSLYEAGLNIFCLVGSFEGSGWARNEKQALRKALRPILAAIAAQGRNALEIATLRSANFLGLHHVTVFAHARHIQRTSYMLESGATAAKFDASQEIRHSTALPAKAA